MSVLDERQPIRGRTPSLINMGKAPLCGKYLEEPLNGSLQEEFEGHRVSLLSKSSASSMRFEGKMTKDAMIDRFKDHGWTAVSDELIFTGQWPNLKDQQSTQSILSDGTDSLVMVSTSASLIGTVQLTDEMKTVSRLKTYLELSRHLGPNRVLNMEKRKNIFSALRLYHENSNVAGLSVNLLEMLAENTEEKAVFSEIMRNFGNVAFLVSSHKTNLDFSLNFMKLVVQIIQKEQDSESQLDDPAYEETFFQIRDQHASNNDIQALFKIISDKLGIEKRELTLIESGNQMEKLKGEGDDVFSFQARRSIIDRLPFTSKMMGINVRDSTCFGYGNWYSRVADLPSYDTRIEVAENEENTSTKSESEAHPEDEWVDDDWIEELDGDLVSWDSDDDDESSVKLVASFADPKEQRTFADPNVQRIYTQERLKELQLQNTHREQTLLEYKEALSKQQHDILKFQKERQSAIVSNTSVKNFMTETDKKSKVEIDKLERENKRLIRAEEDLSKQSGTLVTLIENIQAEKIEKNKEFEELKAKVTQQMATAKEHYIGMRQRVEAANKELANLRDKLEETENKLKASRKEQEKKFNEHTDLQRTYQTMQKEYEKSRKIASNLETSYSSRKLEISSKIATAHQELAKGKSDIRLAYQMQGTFKANILKLKMERATLQKGIQAFQSMNLECDRIEYQLENLKKENIDLQERLTDLHNKVFGGEDLKRLQVSNKKLKMEITELKQMADMLQGIK